MRKPLPPEQGFSKDLLAAVGAAIINWSIVERALGIQLLRVLRAKEMTNADEIAAFAVTAGMEARTLIGLLKSLVSVRFPNHSAEFNKIADCLLSAYVNRRNVLAHRAFALGKKPDRIKVFDIVTVGQMKASTRELTVKEIHNWAQDFFELAIRVDKFLTDRGLPHPRGIGPLGE